MTEHMCSPKRNRKIIRLMKELGDICFYCKRQTYPPNLGLKPKATIDHYIPLSKGGSRDKENIRISCRSCNFIKSDDTAEEFLKELNDIILNARPAREEKAWGWDDDGEHL